MSTNTSEDLANALRLCLGYLTPPITAGERRAVAAAEAALTSPLPQKERPDFIAGYEAGLADGQRCAERDIAERPAAPESCGHESCDCRGYCQRKQPAAPAVPDDVEDRIEAAYWNFDARRKGYGQWASSPMSERDAFKAELRNALWQPPSPEVPNEDAKRLDWLDSVCSTGNGRHLCCLPGGLRKAIDAAMRATAPEVKP